MISRINELQSALQHFECLEMSKNMCSTLVKAELSTRLQFELKNEEASEYRHLLFENSNGAPIGSHFAVGEWREYNLVSGSITDSGRPRAEGSSAFRS